MKLFKSVNLDLINECRFCFNFSLPSELLEKRIAKFQNRYEGIGHIITYILAKIFAIRTLAYM